MQRMCRVIKVKPEIKQQNPSPSPSTTPPINNSTQDKLPIIQAEPVIETKKEEIIFQ